MDFSDETVLCTASRPPDLARVGPTHEWHVDLRKPKGQNDIGKKGLSREGMVQIRVTLGPGRLCRKALCAMGLLPKPTGQSVTLLPDRLNHALVKMEFGNHSIAHEQAPDALF